MKTDRVIERGNLFPPKEKWKSPQMGRVYDPSGLCPTLMANRQGGGREVKIIEYEDRPSDRVGQHSSQGELE
jgi:hypothetical protein